MKKVLIATLTIAALSMGISELFGQQLPQFTQYMFNDYMINPAVAGTHNYYQIRMNNRYQWVGVPDAPLTNTLSVYGPHGSKDMGFGGYLLAILPDRQAAWGLCLPTPTTCKFTIMACVCQGGFRLVD